MLSFPAELVASLREVRSLVVLSGAGVSAESGVPTFRDAQSGLWARYRPEDLATPQAFRRDPRLVWEWYAMRRARLAEVQPNPAHRALAWIEGRLAQEGRQFTLLTQNVDGLHQAAGSCRVVKLHGNLRRVKCFDEGTLVEPWPEDGPSPPRCPRCGGYLRPDVVWFGENLPEQALQQAWQASAACDWFMAVGTSGLVQPAASLPFYAAQRGARLVEVNPQETALTASVQYVLRSAAGQILPALARMVWPDAPDF